MPRRSAITLTTLGLAVPAFAVFPVLFTPHALAKPTPAQLPLFVTLAALEALLFGPGVAFLVRTALRPADAGMRPHPRLGPVRHHRVAVAVVVPA
jgi:hypothetical protein